MSCFICRDRDVVAQCSLCHSNVCHQHAQRVSWHDSRTVVSSTWCTNCVNDKVQVLKDSIYTCAVCRKKFRSKEDSVVESVYRVQLPPLKLRNDQLDPYNRCPNNCIVCHDCGPERNSHVTYKGDPNWGAHSQGITFYRCRACRKEWSKPW